MKISLKINCVVIMQRTSKKTISLSEILILALNLDAIESVLSLVVLEDTLRQNWSILFFTSGQRTRH